MSSHFLAPVVTLVADKPFTGDMDARTAIRAALSVLCESEAEAELVWNAAILLRRWRRTGRPGGATAAIRAHMERYGEGVYERPLRWATGQARGGELRQLLTPCRLPGGVQRIPVRSPWERWGGRVEQEA